MKYILWIDDFRNPNHYAHKNPEVLDQPSFVLWARDVEQAIFYVKRYGLPIHMFLDHDLGPNDTVMTFLRWLYENYSLNPGQLKYSYTIHRNI